MITDEEILEKTGIKREYLSQYQACQCCRYFAKGYTHTFGQGYSVRCNAHVYEEEYPDDLDLQRIWCRGIEPLKEACKTCSLFLKQGNVCFACYTECEK